MVLPAVFTVYRPQIETELRTVTKTNLVPLNNVVNYHLGWIDQRGQPKQSTLGKLVRGTLCLVSCQAISGDYQRALPAAAALELVHSFSLIHDDIEDGSVERHHQPTVWKLWGEAQAINVGDAVYILSHLALLQLLNRGVSPEKVTRCLRVLDEACLELCEGQYLDIAYENRVDISIEDYLTMISKKTGALMAASTCLGALLGIEDKSLINYFYTIGRELGSAYQIQDDILGIWGLEKNTGKPSGDDITKKKKILPVVYGFYKAQGKDKERLLEFYHQPIVERSDISGVVEILDVLKAKAYSQALAEEYYQKALKYMEETNLASSNLRELKELAKFFVEREY